MARTGAIYARLIGSRIRSQVQYRVSFTLLAAAAFMVAWIDFATMAIVFRHIPRLAGWTLPEVAFLFGTSYIPFKTADAAIGHIDALPTYIRDGKLDSFLMRPLSVLGQLMTADFHARWIGGIAQAAGVFVFAVSNLRVDWDTGRVIMCVVTMVSGFILFSAIWIATNTIGFWLPGAREAANAFTYGGGEVTMWPMHIFGRWLRRFLTGVIPLAFVNYFPSLYILGKPDPFGDPPLLRFVAPMVAVAGIYLAIRIWRYGVRRYQSTGS